ncbi:hypothetical protein APX70_08565 [Pseudomonas syringae pv. maculicola]|uniref:Uncharacterized protein n=1 Tax=Pseudomonas syringae pv. maculicola TaxID=59511 RepID=A0A3M3ATN7_PSEYM|nr:hypothetical protein APX70_08565 [Pseudomonas syringae pv. maculicola]
MQCAVEPEQHVVKTHFGTAALLFFKTRTDPLRGMLQHGRIWLGQTVERCFQLRHCCKRRVRRWITFPGLGDAVWGQACEAGAQVQRFLSFVSGPRGELFKPGFEESLLHLAAIDHLAGHGVLAERVELVRPYGPRGFQGGKRCPTLQQRRLDELGRRLGVGAAVMAKQATYAGQQCRRTAPVFPHPGQRVTAHGVAESPPVIAQDFAEQVTVIGFEGLGEQAAAVESMLAQHALAPAVDGRDGGFVHPLRGDVQTAGTGRPLLGLELLAQLADQFIGGTNFVTKEPRSFGQPGTNPVAQLFGGSVGEGHDEDLRRQQFAAKT